MERPVYGALTIDTQVFIAAGFWFDGGLLGELTRFRAGSVKIVLSQIVVSEVINHLKDHLTQVKSKLQSAYKNAEKNGIVTSDLKSVFDVHFDPAKEAFRRMDAYIKRINAAVISLKEVSVEEVMKLYFAGSAPFSTSGDKKHEFPDAIALISFEKWAKQNRCSVIAVSKDKDWLLYGGQSNCVDVVDDLTQALSILQKSAITMDVIDHLLRRVQYGNELADYQDFRKELDLAISNYVVEGKAHAYFDTEIEYVELALIDFEIESRPDGSLYKLLGEGQTKISAAVRVKAEINATAPIIFNVHDSVDDETVTIGSTTAHINTSEIFNVLMIFERKDNLTLSELSVIDGPNKIDFGYVAPDYEGDPDESEAAHVGQDTRPIPF